MVSTVLRAVGLSHLPTFQAYHRVLNRAVWSGLGASHILLNLLVATFAPDGPLVIGTDETIERRRGPKIASGHLPRPGALQPPSLRQSERAALDLPHATGADSLGSASGALPYLTALAPSERQRRHKPVLLGLVN